MKTALLTLTVFLLITFRLYAAEEGDSVEQAEPTAQAELADDLTLPEEGLDGEDGLLDEGLEGPADENFVPTIRITEDLPVSFPVDI